MVIDVSNRVELPLYDLPQQVTQLVKSALTFKNEEREKALKEKLWGAHDLPQTIDLWAERDGKLILPRGFLSKLLHGLDHYAVEYIVEEDYSSAPCETLGEGLMSPLWDHQVPAVESLLAARQGVLEVPTGGGKSAIALAAIQRISQRALVIVDRVNLIDQWAERAREHLGVEVGVIGDNSWEERDITIALCQTISSRLLELDATGWWDDFGVTVGDEIHHWGSAESLMEISSRVSSEYFFGLSATPAMTEVKGKIVEALIGPIVHEVKDEQLYSAGVLMKPRVIMIPTDFDYPFHSTFNVSELETCPLHWCRKSGTKHGHRNNYARTLKALVEDEDRNDLVVDTIFSDRGHHHLVVSRQKKHLYALQEAIEARGEEINAYMLTGDEDREERAVVIESLIHHDQESVLLSTLAFEALDIPCLDRLHLAFPTQAKDDAYLLRQMIGRIKRVAEGKNSAIVYDFADFNVIPFAVQAKNRLSEYSRRQLAVDRRQVKLQVSARD